MKLKCVIVDDEPIARQIVETYCRHLEDLEVVGSYASALEAKQALQSRSVDVIFLDINMPVLDGMAFVRTLRNSPHVIFTTAYKEFAHEAFDLNAVDYLLKPFSLDRFMIAIDKVRERLNPVAQDQVVGDSFIYIKADGTIFKLVFDKLLYAEAKGNNVKVVSESETVEPTMTFTHFEELLPGEIFVRLHRSFIVNLSKISRIEGNRVYVGTMAIPIGASYRSAFFKRIELK